MCRAFLIIGNLSLFFRAFEHPMDKFPILIFFLSLDPSNYSSFDGYGKFFGSHFTIGGGQRIF